MSPIICMSHVLYHMRESCLLSWYKIGFLDDPKRFNVAGKCDKSLMMMSDDDAFQLT